MKIKSLFTFASVGLALGASLLADDRDTTARLAFSDPAKPGKLVVHVSNGEVSVRGADVKEVTVTSALDAKTNGKEKPRKDGLRVIGTSSQFALDEKDNVITLNYGRMGWAENADFDIVVPRDTAVSVQMNLGGEIRIAHLSGDVDIKNLNGEVNLVDLGGSAIVESMNGEINASFTAFPTDKPYAFTSMNGEISVTVPANAAADVRFRTQNGTILTDFDDTTLVTKTEPGSSSSSMSYSTSEEARRIARDAANAARDAMRAAREVAAEVSRAVRAEYGDGNSDAKPSVAPVAPVPPVPPVAPSIPALSGGKVISGQLNGGGASLQISTMNGDIVLRQRKDG